MELVDRGRFPVSGFVGRVGRHERGGKIAAEKAKNACRRACARAMHARNENDVAPVHPRRTGPARACTPFHRSLPHFQCTPHLALAESLVEPFVLFHSHRVNGKPHA